MAPRLRAAQLASLENRRASPPPDFAPNLSRDAPPQRLDARTTPPSSTLDAPADAVLAARDAAHTSLIPAIYGANTSGPSAGTVVGITLGAVGGFLLIMFLLYSLVNFGNDSSGRGFLSGGGSVVEVDASSFGGASSFVSRRDERRARRHRHHNGSSSRRRRSGRETVEIRGSRVRPVIVDPPERVQRIVVEEERIRRASGGGAGRRPGPSVVETVDSEDDEIVVEEEESDHDRRRRRSRVEESDESDDEVVVIEEDSPGPSRRSRRNGSTRRGARR